MRSDRMTRRELFERTLVLVPIAAGSAALLTACGSSEIHCDDLSALTDEQRATRRTQEYVELSPHGNTKDCTNCRFYQGDRQANVCGTCQLVPGPINPKGHCKSWVQVT